MLCNMTTQYAECTCCVLRIRAAVTSRDTVGVSTVTNTSDSLSDWSTLCSWHFRKPVSLVKFCTTPTFAHVTPNVVTTHNLRNPVVKWQWEGKVMALQHVYTLKWMDFQKCLIIKFGNDVLMKLSFFRSILPSPSGLQCSASTSIIAVTPGPHLLIRPRVLLSGSKTWILTGSLDLKRMNKMLER